MSRGRTSLGLASLALSFAACTPGAIVFPHLDDAKYVAAIVLDADNRLLRGSEVRTFDGAIDVLSDDDPRLIIVGWPASAFPAAAVDAGLAIHRRLACEPILPAPPYVAYLDEGAFSPHPLVVPPLAVEWADPLCPELDLDRLGFHVRCADALCPPKLTPLDRCNVRLELEGCLADPLNARVDPDGSFCAASPTCSPTQPSTFECRAPDACVIDALVAEDPFPLIVETAPILDVAPYEPGTDVTGARLEMPPGAHLIGYTYDLAVVADRILVSTSTGAVISRCLSARPSLLHAFAIDDLHHVRTVSAPSCLTLLTASGTSALGLSVEAERFVVSEIDREMQLQRAAELDPRTTAAPGEPALARTTCQRPTDLVVEGDRVYVILEVHAETCGTKRTNVHVLDRRTLQPLARHELRGEAPRRSKNLAGDLWIGDEDSLEIARYDLPEMVRSVTYDVPLGLGRRSVLLADFNLDDGARVVAATTRNQPALRRGAMHLEERAFTLNEAADPVAIWTQNFSGDRGVVLATKHDPPNKWETRASLYDRHRFLILPGGALAGHGPARRLIPDGRGGLLALMPWDATLRRITAR